MNQTSNYGFNVPVGADIVNPLVQDFPNWNSLDTILRNIANTGIVTATHTKSGTIHTLTFTDTTVPMIRFQATADFNTNDTFTVNGLSVSALTVSGEALPDGAFVIGSMVLCELRDNLLTVYSSGSDASTLEGHPASYFATASDLQTVDDKADANKVLIDDLADSLTWKYYSDRTSGAASDLPANWNELQVVIFNTQQPYLYYTFNYNKTSWVQNTQHDNSGYYRTATDYQTCTLELTPTSIRLERLIGSGTEYATSGQTHMHIYYR